MLARLVAPPLTRARARRAAGARRERTRCGRRAAQRGGARGAGGGRGRVQFQDRVRVRARRDRGPARAAQVEDVDASRLAPDAGAAVVTARLREAGDLYAATGKRSEGHCYDNAYTVEYTLARAPDGGWRIADALVTGTT